MAKSVMKEFKRESDDDKVEMDLAEFINEHRELIRILRSGTKAEQMAEADRQEEELAGYLGDDDE